MVLRKMWASPQWKFSSDPSVKKKINQKLCRTMRSNTKELKIKTKFKATAHQRERQSRSGSVANRGWQMGKGCTVWHSAGEETANGAPCAALPQWYCQYLVIFNSGLFLIKRTVIKRNMFVWKQEGPRLKKKRRGKEINAYCLAELWLRCEASTNNLSMLPLHWKWQITGCSKKRSTTSILDKYQKEVTRSKAIASGRMCPTVKAPNPRLKSFCPQTQCKVSLSRESCLYLLEG